MSLFRIIFICTIGTVTFSFCSLLDVSAIVNAPENSTSEFETCAAGLREYLRADENVFILKNAHMNPVLMEELERTSREYFQASLSDKKNRMSHIGTNSSSEKLAGYSSYQTSNRTVSESLSVLVQNNHLPRSPSDLPSVWGEYYHNINIIANALLKCFASAFRVPSSVLVSESDNHLSILKATTFPLYVEEKIETRVEDNVTINDKTFYTIETPMTRISDEAADKSLFSIVSLRDSPDQLLRMQIELGKDEWTDVILSGDDMVLVTGKLFETWTEGMIKAPRVRYVTGEAKETFDRKPVPRRFAISYHVLLSADAKIDCKQFVGADCTKKPFTLNDWVLKNMGTKEL